jgi:hypothetical protein
MNFRDQKLFLRLRLVFLIFAIFVLLYFAAGGFLRFMEKKCSDKCLANGGLSYAFIVPDTIARGYSTPACRCIKADNKAGAYFEH